MHRKQLERVLPTISTLLIGAGLCAAVAVYSAVDAVQLGPGAYASIELSDSWTVGVAAGVVAIFAAMVVSAWLFSRRRRMLRRR
jgi:hypothetical protein